MKKYKIKSNFTTVTTIPIDMKLKYSVALQCFAVFFFLNGYSQTGKSLWEKSTKTPKTENLVLMDSEPLTSTIYKFNLDAFKAKLLNAPDRKSLKSQSNLIVDLPGENGQMQAFRVKEASVMHPELQARYPEIRSYVGESVNNPGTTTRFSVTPLGLHAMTFTKQGVRFINPYTKDGELYMEFSKKDMVSNKSFLCEFSDDNLIEENKSSTSSTFFNANDGMMRTFRLALASTVEYSQFHWQAAGIPVFGTVAQKKAAVLAAMVVTMTRVNGVYERELSMTMELIANNDAVIFIGTDTYTNNDGPTMLGENTTVLNSTIGSANYDIGHVFSTGGGGIASLNSPCTGNKARGVTGLTSPVGDVFDIDFVCHEMGHQYGAPHTFNGDTGNCGGGNRTASNAYEPGSGTTIMAYAGICAPQNVQSNSDDYFHQKSLQMIWSNVTTGASTCAAQSATGNTAPTAEAGANYTIPISTPYMLTGSSTDVDGTGTHTYTWEQYDLGPSGVPTETTSTGPLVRSSAGTENPVRYVPRLNDLFVTGGSTTWEKLVSIGRAINFRLTVRDNDPDGGQTATDITTLTVDGTKGPLTVTSQNTDNLVWMPGTTETVTWTVNNTNTIPGGANVDILYTSDNGETWIPIVTGVANDGSQDITVPSISEPYCRIMVKASANIFFNVNSKNLAIGNYTYAPQNVCEDYTFDLSAAITESSDNNYPGTLLPITDSYTITDIKTYADITHPNIGQVNILFWFPWSAGLNTGIWYNQTACTNADMDKWFDLAGVAPTCSTNGGDAFLPYSATNFNGAIGQNSAGEWRIYFKDVVVDGSGGVFNTFTIQLCHEELLPILSTDSFDFDDLAVYPNPNNGTFNIKMNALSNTVKVGVYDMRGRQIFLNDFQANGRFDETINLQNTQSGMYLLTIQDDQRKITKKIIIE